MSPFPRSAYRALTRYTPDRRPIDVDLSDNTSRWGAHPAALRIIREAESGDLTRYPPVYADRLREAVAEHFGIPVECIATGCGSDDLLDATFRAAGDAGERIAFCPPTFSMVEVFARMNGLEPQARSVGGIHGLRTLLDDDPALVYLCRPNNPTGDSVARAQVYDLLAAAGTEGPIILVDEAYADFAEDHFLGDAAGSDRLLVLRTFSKAYGLAGLRVGFAVGPSDVIQEVEKSRGPYKVGRLAEEAAAAALTDEEGWIPKVVEQVRAGRTRLHAELERRGWATLSSEANFLLLPLRGVTAEEVTASLRGEGVAVRPFPALPGIGDSIRISIGSPPDVDRFLEAWDRVLS